MSLFGADKSEHRSHDLAFLCSVDFTKTYILNACKVTFKSCNLTYKIIKTTL